MSYTTIKAVWPEEKSQDLLELHNAHGAAPVVWNEIAKRYLGLKDYEYSFHCDELWPLYMRQDMPDHQRAVLMMTFDNVLVMKPDYKQAAADIRAFLTDFPQRDGYVNHWPEIAALFDSNPDCPAIGFYMTSVGEDPFQGPYNDDTDDYDQPDWSVYWNIYAEAEKWRAPNAEEV